MSPCNLQPKTLLKQKKRFHRLKHLSLSYPIFILWQRGGSCKGVKVAQGGSVINGATQFNCPVIMLSFDPCYFIHFISATKKQFFSFHYNSP